MDYKKEKKKNKKIKQKPKKQNKKPIIDMYMYYIP